MKTPSDELFKLIKSMDKAEKRHFKLFSMQPNAGSKSKNYLVLFDAINKQTNYNESQLVKNIKKREVINNFIKAKNYLQESIISFLVHYHSGASADSMLRRLLERSEILTTKRLFKPALRTLLKAEKLALRLENYSYLVIINNQKLNVYIYGNLLREMEEYLQDGIRASLDHMSRLRNFVEIKNLNIATTLNYLRKRKYGKFNRQEVDKISDSPVLKSLDKATSFPAKVSFNNIRNFLQALTPGNKEVEYERLKSWLAYLERNIDKLQNGEEHYIVAFSTIALMTDELKGGLRELNELYNKLTVFYSNLPPKKKNNQLTFYYIRILNNYLDAFLKFGKPEMAGIIFKEIKKVESFNARAELNSSTKMLLYNNMFYAAFLLGQFREAMKWITKIIHSKDETGLDIQSAARISLLIIHFELENADLLPSLFRKTERFLMKNNCYNEFERTMIRFFENEYPEANNKLDRIEAFKKLKQKFEYLIRAQKKPEAFNFFDYISWVESKIQHRPLNDIIKDRSPNSRQQ